VRYKTTNISATL